MASTQRVTYANNDYAKGIGREEGTLVWDGGTDKGDIVPGSSSGIKKIRSVVLQPTTELATFPAQVISYSAANDTEVVTVTGVANSSFRYEIEGEVFA